MRREARTLDGVPLDGCSCRCDGASLMRLTRSLGRRSTSAGSETARKLVAVSLLAAALLLIQASASQATGHGGRGGSHGFPGRPGFPPGFRGHPGFPRPPGFPGPSRFHGHFRGHGVVVVGPSVWWGPWWYYPPPYYYYPPPQVVVEAAPVIVEEQQPQSYWYYCPSARAYYPTAPTCPEPWIKVPPRAQ